MSGTQRFPGAAVSSTEEKLASELRVDVRLWGVGFAMHTVEGARRIPPDSVTLDIGKLERSSVAPPAVLAPPGSVPEAIYWRHPENDRPDCDTTVLVHVSGAPEPVYFGYWDGEWWCSIDDSLIWPSDRVRAWAGMPAGAVP